MENITKTCDVGLNDARFYRRNRRKISYVSSLSVSLDDQMRVDSFRLVFFSISLVRIKKAIVESTEILQLYIIKKINDIRHCAIIKWLLHWMIISNLISLESNIFFFYMLHRMYTVQIELDIRYYWLSILERARMLIFLKRTTAASSLFLFPLSSR